MKIGVFLQLMKTLFCNRPRLVIAGAKGGAGKTIATLGIICRLTEMGMKIAPFKKGPDYIDARWLGIASHIPCHNLDPFLMDKETIISSFLAHSNGYDISIIEGNRGIYDGVDIEGAASTAMLSKIIKSPVILTLDCTKITRTGAAIALGIKLFDPSVNIRGIILNKVAGERHRQLLIKSIEKYAQIPVIGTIPRLKKDPLPMRHLGVTPVDEHPDFIKELSELSKKFRDWVDIDAVLSIAKDVTPIEKESKHVKHIKNSLFINRVSQDEKKTAKLSDDTPDNLHTRPTAHKIRVGVLRDTAFQFYYPENIESIRRAGAEVIFIDAIKDTILPEVHCLYIGGGFPETQGKRLAENLALKHAIKKLIDEGLPVYAECGGFMYLGDKIIYNNAQYPMVGVINCDFKIERRPQGHGYTELTVTRPTPFHEIGMTIRGHEFHYSCPIWKGGKDTTIFSCKVKRGHGVDGEHEGILYKNIFATYTHIHALEQKDFGTRLIRAAQRFLSLYKLYNQSETTIND